MKPFSEHVEKGFIRVPIREVKLNEAVSFDEKFSTGVLIIKMKGVVKQHLAITDGAVYVKDGKFLYRFYRERGKALIPGSSIKGAVRTYAEAFLGDKAKAIFGDTNYASHVKFNDVLIEEENLKFEPFDSIIMAKPTKQEKSVKLYTLKPSQEIRRRNDALIEVLPENYSFITEICVEGLSHKQITALLFCFGIADDYTFYVKMGRGKNLGMGAVHFHLERSTLYKSFFPEDNAKIIQNLMSKQNVEKFLKEHGINPDELQKNILSRLMDGGAS